jgi:large subunit ribosomal protein L6
VAVPNGVQVNVKGSDVHVKGPKGEMKRSFSPLIEIALEDGHVVIKRKSDNAAERALHGTTRAVIANMVHGVSSGFEIVLEVDGVGYRAEMQGKDLALFVGYSHPVKFPPPKRSAAKPVRPGKEPSKPWRKILVRSRARAVTCVYAKI